MSSAWSNQSRHTVPGVTIFSKDLKEPGYFNFPACINSMWCEWRVIRLVGVLFGEVSFSQWILKFQLGVYLCRCVQCILRVKSTQRIERKRPLAVAVYLVSQTYLLMPFPLPGNHYSYLIINLTFSNVFWSVRISCSVHYCEGKKKKTNLFPFFMIVLFLLEQCLLYLRLSFAIYLRIALSTQSCLCCQVLARKTVLNLLLGSEATITIP